MIVRFGKIAEKKDVEDQIDQMLQNGKLKKYKYRDTTVFYLGGKAPPQYL